ncbi:NADH-quinone oxidoreductase subunit NuoB [Martelella alba]|uniref:NADH-quinone oxidoreductase subunit NuoB n=1 Tax=Martelella alba TaxID=2590451 RepID=A0ABY2SGG1_9HYPH|nr:NADH-quinone oxidoreductase subunit NuoB [Martelella alba]TKI03962.1 NADH-quinone oxidoreductase subunit NuoB [Martelella alba]
MPLWTLRGLRRGQVTTDWPKRPDDPHGQQGTLGMPRVTGRPCGDECRRCEEVCPTGAITTDMSGHLAQLDYGRCIACQLCVEHCPGDAIQTDAGWAFGVRERRDLLWTANDDSPDARRLKRRIDVSFGGSLHIRHVDAGSCNGCETELQALNNPFYNFHRLGIFFTASPRAADLLLVTGTVTAAMREPLLATWQGMPEPRYVLACGTCAVSGGVCGGGYASGQGLDGILPVDIWLPGCPPNPAAIIDALLLLLERRSQHVRGGRLNGA